MRILSYPPQQVELKMTAMIDVIFLLLVFFVCTANFTEPENKLPVAGGRASTVLETQLTVHIHLSLPDDHPLWTVESNQCRSLNEVTGILRKLKDIKTNIPVVLKNDADVPMDCVIRTYDACRKAGLTNVLFSVKK